MKAVCALMAILALAPPAHAAGRPSTTTMTCQSAQALVARAGAIVLGTGGQTYDRFVRFESACATGLYGHPAFRPTRDNPQCNIGYYCTAERPIYY